MQRMMGAHGPVVTVVATPKHSALLQLKIMTLFDRKTYYLKPLCIRNDIKALLSQWYREINSTVTSLIGWDLESQGKVKLAIALSPRPCSSPSTEQKASKCGFKLVRRSHFRTLNRPIWRVVDLEVRASLCKKKKKKCVCVCKIWCSILKTWF